MASRPQERGAAPATSPTRGSGRGASPQGSGAIAPSPSAPVSPSPSPSPSPSSSTTPSAGPINTKFPGLTTFRGNATRTYYGEGPLPSNPVTLWRYPRSGGLCHSSTDARGTRVWCGTGWTGQPNVIPHSNGTIEIREGAYDGHYHFLNGKTGRPMRPDIVTRDLAKGSATSDPDGFPLYYGGSRDNNLRVIALDRARPTVLWSLNSHSSVPFTMWNDDWDGAPLVIGDYLLEGGENSWFYVIRLHRHYDSSGKVQVDPEIVMRVKGWDARELRDIGDKEVSIENSVAFHKGVVYFANSGGLVQGWDISDILQGGTSYRRVFRFWDGDDTDASIVIDQQGYLYVARERQRFNARDDQVGELVKLDPRKPGDPVVWSVHVRERGADGLGGLWSTPALYDGTVYVTANYGGLIAVNQETGKVYYRMKLPGPTWMSPVPIDHQLLVGDCVGVLHNFDISNPRKRPKELWRVQLDGCIESTPAVWHGMIWVGARGGPIYGIGDPR